MRMGILMAATALAVGLLGVSAPGAEAQSRTLRNTSGPAEQPPADFTGRQYVDSRGCVFMRTGRGGQTTWVPRVTRTREVVCGQSPTGGGGTAVATAAPTPAPAPARAATPAPVVVAAPSPAPTRAPVVRQGTASVAAAAAASTRAAPRRVRVAAAPSSGRMQAVTQSGGVQIAAAPTRVVGGHGCGASALSAAYLPGCGRGTGQVASVAPVQVQQIRTTSYGVGAAAPVQQVQVAPARVAAAPAQGVVSGHGCGASALSRQYLSGVTHCGAAAGYNTWGTQNPVHAGQRIPSVVGVAPPAGYRPAFQDGRLNPNRGLVTHSGAVQSQQIWTRTVPRRLVPSYHGGRQVIIVTR